MASPATRYAKRDWSTMNKEAGFSIVELITVVVLTAALSGILFQFTIGYMKYASVVESDSIAFVDRLNASDYLRENLSQATGLINQPALADSYPLAPDPADANYWKLLYTVRGTFGNTTEITPIVYFARHSHDTSGNLQKQGEKYLDDEYVLYHDGPKQELRVRRLANPAVLNNAVSTTCPPAHVSAACREDVLLASNITSVAVRYFSRAGNDITITSTGSDALGDTITPCAETTEPYTTCTGATFDSVEVVEFTLNLAKTPSGANKTSTKSATIIRVAIRDDNS